MSAEHLASRHRGGEGLGIARLPSLVAEEALRAGRLVALLESYVPPATLGHLVDGVGRPLPSRTRAFLDFVERWLAPSLNEAISR